MRLPVSWLRDFVTTDSTPQRIADILTSRGFTVDAIAPQLMPDMIVVGRIETLAPHPDADKLQVSTVDTGSSGTLQIVTGARNVAVGDKVPIALVGSVVYTGTTDANGAPETKAINKAKLRGVDSNGMMASANELALPGEFEDGILIMDAEAPVGAAFWSSVRFGDAVLDVDVPSNRADCLSVIGLAREAAAGLGAHFAEPSWGTGAGATPSPIAVEIGDPAVCRRLVGQFFSGLRNRRAPLWMTLRLHAANVRSIDLLVDVSNYVQLETGQPLHFYDASLVKGGRIIARSARDGERVVTLDGVERTLAAGTPVIADGERVVGIAGIFGGLDASVKASTTDVFLESPNFVGPRIRRAAIALGLRTEGGMRHERNLPLELPELGRRRAADLLIAAGATPSAVVEAGEKPATRRTISFRPARANALLGTDHNTAKMIAAIEPIGLSAKGSDTLEVSVPWWRPDLVDEVDIIEEVARGIGYDGIAERRSVAAPQAVDDSLFDQDRTLARSSAALGYLEIVSIALQGTRVIEAWERSGLPYWSGLATVDNPLSDDQRFLRPSLLPGLLASAGRAWPRANGSLRLFEVGHVFRSLDSSDEKGALSSHDGMYVDNGVIEWPSLCAIAMFGAEDESGALDRHLLAVKGDAQRLVVELAGELPETVPAPRHYLHPLASADLRLGGKTVAKFGRLHPRLANAYELPPATYAFMLYMEELPHVRPALPFVPLPKFPGTRRDIAVVVGLDVTAGDLMNAIIDARVDAFERVAAFDEYVGPQIASGKKSIALAIWLRRHDTTITDAQADASVAGAVGLLRDKFGAELRGPAA
jgi:phenylalanyl-tRNA synthetase beta chain